MARGVTGWGDRIGHRLKLRDLYVLSTVVKFGSMAKAAAHLRITQPAISQSIADLEATLGARLLDRGPRGVSLTVYGDALLRSGSEAFDALKQGIGHIEFLKEPGSGEVCLGASESNISGGYLSTIIAALTHKYPRIVVHVVEAKTSALEFQELRSRRVDLMLGRISGPVGDDDLQIESLFKEPVVCAVGAQNPLARRRKIELSELLDQPWILAPPNTAVHDLVISEFRKLGFEPPRLGVTSYSLQLRMQMLGNGNFVGVLPASVLRYNADRWSLKMLPIKLGEPLPVVIATVKNRTLSPAVNLFIQCARAVTKSIASSGARVTNVRFHLNGFRSASTRA